MCLPKKKLKGAIKEASGEAGMQEQTAMLYLDNMFPLRFNALDFRQWFFRSKSKRLNSRAARAIPTPEEIGHGFTIKNLEAR